ncbi:MAG TPA: SDR family NAD(P)-dependent oxidoreductase [Pseudomonadales bacterium]|nr:SDR family NAD(P)-dependent oxidoreductase [Pseudomonadales bacterium]
MAIHANRVDRFSLAGKTALVTGAGSGLGERFAHVLAEAGAKVACCGRRVDAVERVASQIREDGGEAFACVMDITNRDSVNVAFDKIEKALGPVQVLINNAGQSQAAPFTEMSEQQWQDVLDANLSGTWRVSQEMARRLIAKQQTGTIVNIASILGLLAKNMFSNYSATKAALIHLTKSMAIDLLPNGIRVNALAPGYISTDLTAWYFETDAGKAEIAALPPKRLGRLEELEGPLLLLASDASSYMSGSVLVVDYAHSARLS